MIRRKEEIPIRTVAHAQGGKGSVIFTDWLLPADAPGHGRVISKLVIPAGCSIGDHTHSGEFEAFYVLSGTVRVNDNGTPVVLHAGDMHLCEDGQLHGTENDGPEDAVLLALILNTLA